jgi:uracil-DNA glycosylase
MCAYALGPPTNLLVQDPYHGVGQAEGWSFSVPKGQRIPSSLCNIYKELGSDLGYSMPSHGHLEHWVDQGVLLMNTVLTVQVCTSS